MTLTKIPPVSAGNPLQLADQLNHTVNRIIEEFPIPEATATTPGLITATDKAKLDGISGNGGEWLLLTGNALIGPPVGMHASTWSTGVAGNNGHWLGDMTNKELYCVYPSSAGYLGAAGVDVGYAAYGAYNWSQFGWHIPKSYGYDDDGNPLGSPINPNQQYGVIPYWKRIWTQAHGSNMHNTGEVFGAVFNNRLYMYGTAASSGAAANFLSYGKINQPHKWLFLMLNV